MVSRDQIKAFTKTPWFRVVYLALVGIFVSWMYAVFLFSSAVCLAFLVMSLTVFVVPFWFGERNARRFLLNGLVIFAIAVVLAAAFRAQIVLAAEPFEIESFPGLDPALTLQNGTVVPFHSGPGAYNFSVDLITPTNSSPANFSVWLNLTIIENLVQREESYPMSPALDPDNDTISGARFTYEVDLVDAVYGMWFYAESLGGNWTATTLLLGPVVASASTWYVFFLVFGSPALILPLVFYFFILFMWWYSGRMRRTRERMLERGRRREEPAAHVDPEKAGKAAAFTCTNCGADVEDTDEKCPKCGAVFED